MKKVTSTFILWVPRPFGISRADKFQVSLSLLGHSVEKTRNWINNFFNFPNLTAVLEGSPKILFGNVVEFSKLSKDSKWKVLSIILNGSSSTSQPSQRQLDVLEKLFTLPAVDLTHRPTNQLLNSVRQSIVQSRSSWLEELRPS